MKVSDEFLTKVMNKKIHKDKEQGTINCHHQEKPL